MFLDGITSLATRAHEWMAHTPPDQHGQPVVALASLGIPDTLAIFVVALVVFGPKRLPEIGRQIGKLVFEFRRASNDFKLQIEEELRLSEQQERQKELEAKAAAAMKASPAPVATESVAALPAATETTQTQTAPTETAAEPQGLVIQPPSSGTLVEARPPNRSVVESAEEQFPPPPARERMANIGNGIGGSSAEIREAIARGTAVEPEVDRQEAGLENHPATPAESTNQHHG